MALQNPDREIEIVGPDDVRLLIGPAPQRFHARPFGPVRVSTDYQVWRIQNDALRPIPKIQLQILSVQTFDERKSAFREAVALEFRWQPIANLGAGESTEPATFLTADGDHLNFIDGPETSILRWPNADKSYVRHWRLSLKVLGLSEEWLIGLDLRWTPAANTIEIMESSDETADAVSSVAEGDPPHKPRRKPRARDLLESLSPDDPNYKLVKRSYLKAWSDSHGLVADGFARRVSLPDLVNGCVGTFRQGARLLVDYVDETPIPAKCKEIDRMATQFIRKFRKSLSMAPKHFTKADLKRASDELSRCVHEIASRSKQSIMEKALVEEPPLPAPSVLAPELSSAMQAVEDVTHAVSLQQPTETLGQIQRLLKNVTASGSSELLQSATAHVRASDEFARIVSNVQTATTGLGGDATGVVAAAITAQSAMESLGPLSTVPSHGSESLAHISGRSKVEGQNAVTALRVPRRKPDLETSRNRIAYVNSLATELVTLTQTLHRHTSVKSLKKAHPELSLWKVASNQEIQEILEGHAFKPKMYAEHLALRKFGITSRETLKKDRQKIKRADRARAGSARPTR